ncbi:MAG: signal peptidase I [Candidatus Omnitrophica bacterium]|nr:signal peptidase I [Candidatus Omnitrophota bacterium]
MKPRVKSVVKEYAESIIIALILAMIVRTFVVQAFKIPTGSMRMTLIERDRILVNKYIYRHITPKLAAVLTKYAPIFREPERGDVVVFRYPLEPKRDFIKRLIGKPGETVKIENGFIYINGERIDSPPAIKQTYYYNNHGDYGTGPEGTKIPEDSYFVLGDNSAYSQDSRYWGFVPRKYLLGKAMVIYWPINRMRIIR